MEPLPDTLLQQVHALVDQYRAQCLWYLREDYYPRTAAETLRVLDAIERHGDLAAFKRAGAIRQWLSQNSSAPSAGQSRGSASRAAKAMSRETRRSAWLRNRRAFHATLISFTTPQRRSPPALKRIAGPSSEKDTLSI